MSSLFTTAEESSQSLGAKIARRVLRLAVPWGSAGVIAILARWVAPQRLGGQAWLLLWVVLAVSFSIFWENILRRRRHLRPLHSQVRYFPVLDLLDRLRKQGPAKPSILEVGSGNIGLGSLLPYRFTGCDLRFDGPTSENMTPVVGSALELPFTEKSFDWIISVDTLEHLTSRLDREKALNEMLRVAKLGVIVGFPCGPDAQAADEALSAEYRGHAQAVPAWLEEHLANGLPEKDLVEETVGDRYHLERWPSESATSHLWLMTRDWAPTSAFALSLAMAASPKALRFVFRVISHYSEKSYRHFYLLKPKP